MGSSALAANTTGGFNTAIGYQALLRNTIGTSNTAIGGVALVHNTNGIVNPAVGQEALTANTAGTANTAVGFQTLETNTTGNFNVALGFQAGFNLTTGSNNIDIGNVGQPSDNSITRIGASQTAFFAAGIRGITTVNNDAIPVVIDSQGQLGTVSSSRRFKEDIVDMGDASRGLMDLRPVTYRYKHPFADGSKPIQYGLIAEEVAEVYPDLVAHSADRQIETVKYQVLDSMLLNEVQRLQRQNQNLQERLEKLEAALAKVVQ